MKKLLQVILIATIILQLLSIYNTQQNINVLRKKIKCQEKGLVYVGDNLCIKTN